MNNAKNQQSKKSKGPAKQAAAATAAAKQSVKAERKAVKAANRLRFAAAASGSKLSAESIAIAASIIAPDSFPPARYQDGYDAEPTALFEPKTIADITFSSVAQGVDGLGYSTDEQWLFGFRDPRRGLVIQNHVNSANSVYGLASSTGNISVTRVAGAALDLAVAGYSSGPKLHGQTLYGGTPDDNASVGGFFPINYGDSIAQTTVSGLPASTVCVLTVMLSAGDDQLIPASLTATSAANGTCTWGFLNANLNQVLPTNWFGYIRLDYVNAQTSNAFFTITYANNNASFSHYTVGNFENVATMIDAVRFNGMGLMFTNTVSELNRQGDLVACQIPKSVSWSEVVQSGFSGLQARPNSVPLRADNGCQIFWKPTAPFDMQFTDVGNGALGDVDYYPLSAQSDYLAICIRIPVVAGRSGKAQLHFGGEGRTSSPWFALSTGAPGDRAASAAAMDFVRSYQQVHENPKHVRDAIEFLKKNKRPITLIASALGTAIPTLAPLAAMVNAGIGAL